MKPAPAMLAIVTDILGGVLGLYSSRSNRPPLFGPLDMTSNSSMFSVSSTSLK
jgi:hypothetical protein